MADLNHRPSGLESDALPTELIDHNDVDVRHQNTKSVQNKTSASKPRRNTHALKIIHCAAATVATAPLIHLEPEIPCPRPPILIAIINS